MKTPLLRRIAIVAAATIGLGVLTPVSAYADPGDPWLVPDAAQRLPIAIQAPGITSTLDEFPVLVTIDGDDVDYADLDPDHLVFTAATDAAPLPYEVENWDPAGTSSIWVKAPSVAGTAATIDMYFDGAPANATSPTDVWDDGYEVVAHMNDSSGGAADSTRNGFHAAEADSVGGLVYRESAPSGTPAIRFDNDEEHLVYAGEGNIPSATAEQLTVSATVYLDANHFTSPENHVFSRYASATDRPWGLFIHNNVSNVRATIGGVWTQQASPSVSALSRPGWYDVVFKYDGAFLDMFYDGERLLHSPFTGPLLQSPTAVLRLGANAGLLYEPDSRAGWIFDEFRVSTLARSDDWIKAESLARTGRLATPQSVETRDGGVSLMLAITSPTADAVVGGEATLAGTTNQPATISYSIDGAPAVSLGAQSGPWSTQLAGLGQGERTVAVTATVDGQAPVTQSATFTVDTTQPEITVESPVDGASYGADGLLIDVDAADPAGVDRIALTLDGAPVRNDRRIIPSTSGEHTLAITAVDAVGNTATRTVVFEAEGPGAEREPWRVPDAAERLPITVRGEGLEHTVTGFPVLVQFGPDDVDFATLDAAHLAFYAAGSATALPYEVETWDPAGVTSIWVKAPSVGTTASQLFMYYDGAPENTIPAADVWDDDFLAVTHMNGDAGPVADSTGGDNPLTVVRGAPEFGSATASQTPGIRLGAGQALEYASGVADDVENITMTTSIYLDPAHVDATSLENYIAAREVSGFPADDQFTWLLHQGSIGPRLAVDGAWSYTDRNTVAAGWHTLSWSYDGTRLVQLIDGVKVQDWEHPGVMRPSSSLPLRLGEMPSGSYPAKAGYVYDEFRVSAVARSVDWQRAEYLAATGRLAVTGAAEASTEGADLGLTVTAPRADASAPVEPMLTGTVTRTALIEFRLDGGDWTPVGERLGAFNAPLGVLAGGPHTLQVRATSGADVQTATVEFAVDGVLPEISFTAPRAGANYGEAGVDIDVEATDDSGIASLSLVLDGTPVENSTHLAPADMIGDDHVLVATATDNAGNTRVESVAFIAVGTGTPDAWLIPEARKRIPFEIQAPVTSAVGGFPALIQFDNRMLDYSTIDADHIVFTAGDDPTPLPYDVERWHSSAQISSIWVRIPKVTDVAQTITMYFDGVDENQTNPTDVWDANHEFVAHFGLPASPIPDASGHGTQVDQYTQQGYWAGAGNESPAVQIDGAPALYIEGGAGATAGNLMISMTAQVPVGMLEPDTGRHILAARGVPGGSAADDQFGLYIEDGILTAAIRTGSGWASTNTVIEAGWHTIQMTYDGSVVKIYLDGEQKASQHNGQPTYKGSTAPITIGSLADGTSPAISLVVDEFRVSDSNRNADWALLEYLSASKQLSAAGGMQTADSAPVLYLGLPAPSETYGPGVLAVSGSTWEPLALQYAIDGGAPVDLGTVHGDFGDTVEGLADGEHEIVLTGIRPSGRVATRTATFSIDRAGPEIDFRSPLQGRDYQTDFSLDVDANDPNGVESLHLALDGATVENGTTVSLEDVVGLSHELVAVATDTVGNVTTSSITFTAPGAIPAVPVDPQPADGATGVDPSAATLSALVADASGEPLDVTFHWTYVGSADSVAQGATVDGLPPITGGDPASTEATVAADGAALTNQLSGAYPYQRFEVTVPSDLGADEFQVEWTGEVPVGHRIRLSAWDRTAKEWVQLAGDEGGAPVTLHALADTKRFVEDEKAILLAQDVPAAVLDTDTQTRFYWLTDTQFYTEYQISTYDEMAQWVLDHRESEDIVYGIHTGDITNSADSERQWQQASDIHAKWDEAKFPYGIVAGNHDVSTWDSAGHATYRRWFGEDRFASNPWYGGTESDNVDHYDIVSTPNADYLFLYLGMSITPATVAWANEVIRSHPDHNVIIGLHVYLLPFDGHDYEYQGRMVYDQIVAPNPDVGMVLSGHNCAPVTRVQHPTPERTVYEVMHDPQCNPNGGDGWARFIDFDTESATMTHSTFSIKKEGDSYWPDGQPSSGGSLDLVENENRTDPYDLHVQTRSISTDSLTVSALGAAAIQGETVTAESGARATLELDDLEPNHEYFWYATSKNSRGYSSNSPVWSFTTGDAPEHPAPAPVKVDTTPGGSVAADATEALPGATVTVTATPDEGHHFVRWRVAPEGVVIGPDGTFTMPHEPVTVAAVFAPNSYTVAFDPNGGTGTIDAMTLTYGVDATLPSAARLTRDGFEFGGWATSADGPAVHADGATVHNLSTEADATVTLYAVWRDVTAPIVTVTRSSQGSNGVYTSVGYVLEDAGTIDRVVLNGRTVDVSNGTRVELDALKPGALGAVLGENVLEVYDVAGNLTTVEFTLLGSFDAPVPRIESEKGTIKPGALLTVVPGNWEPSPELSVQWYADGRAIPRADSLEFRLTGTYIGQEITVKVTGRLDGYETATVVSDPVVARQGKPEKGR